MCLAQGVPHVYHVLPGAGHGFPFDGQGEGHQATTKFVFDFVVERLRLPVDAPDAPDAETAEAAAEAST